MADERLAFQLVVDPTPDAELLAEAIEYHEHRCKCENQIRFMLHIESGCIEVCCAECGKPPWWMLDDFNESVGMDPIMVQAVVTGTKPDYNGEIDGPQVDLTLITP